MEHKRKLVKRELEICRVVTDDNLRRREIRLNFLHNYFASADGRIWKKREITKYNSGVWREVTAAAGTGKHRSKQVNVRDKKGKMRKVSRAFLVLCAFRGYAGKWFYAAHLKDRCDDSLGNLRWRFRITRTRKNRREFIFPSFFDLFEKDDAMLKEWMAELAKMPCPAEARCWNEKLMKRFEESVNGGRKFRF